MIKQMFITLLFTLSVTLFSQNIDLRGTYQGENLYVQNPFASSGVGFCIYEVTVNGMTTTDEINSSAFEIDLTVFGFDIGQDVSISVKCKETCSARVLNPDVLKPRATFEIVSLKVEGSNVVWTTKNESGSMPFFVEQFKWNKWVNVGEVNGKGSWGENVYKAPVRFHSGENRFRIRQTDNRNVSKYSNEVKIRSKVSVVTYSIEKNSQIIFSQPTMYEIYDFNGRIILKSFGDVVSIDGIERGRYYLNYDNKTDMFNKR